MLDAVFNETEAQEVLAIINKKVAGAFKTEPKIVRFVFVSYIASSRRGRVCLGLCLHKENEIQIKVSPGWQRVAIHELAHLYNPDGSEKRTNQVADDIIRYLKGVARC